MKKLLSVFTFALLAVPSLAHAVDFEVFGQCGESVLTDHEEKMQEPTVFKATSMFLVRNGLGAPKTNTENNYVSAIGGLGERETRLAATSFSGAGTTK